MRRDVMNNENARYASDVAKQAYGKVSDEYKSLSYLTLGVICIILKPGKTEQWLNQTTVNAERFLIVPCQFH